MADRCVSSVDGFKYHMEVSEFSLFSFDSGKCRNWQNKIGCQIFQMSVIAFDGILYAFSLVELNIKLL